MIKCKGCGIILQSEDKNVLGYTPDIKNELCQRCFKLKNYNTLINNGVNIDNDKLIKKINSLNVYVLFLVDFLNIDSEAMDLYKKINVNKTLVITKEDIIPKNIIKDRLIKNIKDIYEISEDIILTSTKFTKNISNIESICLKEKKVLLAGYTNAGKSSLINKMVGSDITVSSRENTTQDFIKLNVDGVTIYDAPGFMSNTKRDVVSKNIIKPKTYQLPSKHYLEFNNIKLNVSEDSNITLYLPDEVIINRRREKNNITCDVLIPKNSDLVIKGLGFIKFSKTSLVSITGDYEIRPSIVGANNE